VILDRFARSKPQGFDSRLNSLYNPTEVKTPNSRAVEDQFYPKMTRSYPCERILTYPAPRLLRQMKMLSTDSGSGLSGVRRCLVDTPVTEPDGNPLIPLSAPAQTEGCQAPLAATETAVF